MLHRPPRRSAAVPDGSVRSQSSGMKAALGPVRRVWCARGGGGPWLRLPVVHASSRVRMSKWSASRSSRVARSSVWRLWCVPTSPSRPSRTARPESSRAATPPTGRPTSRATPSRRSRPESPRSAQLAFHSPHMASMCAVGRLGVSWCVCTSLLVDASHVPVGGRRRRQHACAAASASAQKPRRGHTRLTARCACPCCPLAPGAGWICPDVASSLSRSKICVASAERRQNGRAEGWQKGISPDPQRRPPLTSRRVLAPTGPGHRGRSFGALLMCIFPLVQRPFCLEPPKTLEIGRVGHSQRGVWSAAERPLSQFRDVARTPPSPVTGGVGHW